MAAALDPNSNNSNSPSINDFDEESLINLRPLNNNNQEVGMDEGHGNGQGLVMDEINDIEMRQPRQENPGPSEEKHGEIDAAAIDFNISNRINHTINNVVGNAMRRFDSQFKNWCSSMETMINANLQNLRSNPIIQDNRLNQNGNLNGNQHANQNAQPKPKEEHKEMNNNPRQEDNNDKKGTPTKEKSKPNPFEANLLIQNKNKPGHLKLTLEDGIIIGGSEFKQFSNFLEDKAQALEIKPDQRFSVNNVFHANKHVYLISDNAVLTSMSLGGTIINANTKSGKMSTIFDWLASKEVLVKLENQSRINSVEILQYTKLKGEHKEDGFYGNMKFRSRQQPQGALLTRGLKPWTHAQENINKTHNKYPACIASFNYMMKMNVRATDQGENQQFMVKPGDMIAIPADKIDKCEIDIIEFVGQENNDYSPIVFIGFCCWKSANQPIIQLD